MCMTRVDYATILTEPVRAWKAFRLSPDGRLYGAVMYETEFPREEWLEAKPWLETRPERLDAPRRYRHWMKDDDGNPYLMGFHAYRFHSYRSRDQVRVYDAEVILPVLLRGIAYYGVHDYGVYGWCAQEMFIDVE